MVGIAVFQFSQPGSQPLHFGQRCALVRLSRLSLSLGHSRFRFCHLPFGLFFLSFGLFFQPFGLFFLPPGFGLLCLPGVYDGRKHDSCTSRYAYGWADHLENFPPILKTRLCASFQQRYQKIYSRRKTNGYRLHQHELDQYQQCCGEMPDGQRRKPTPGAPGVIGNRSIRSCHMPRLSPPPAW